MSIQSGTKYIGGHSDLMLGTISANADTWPRRQRHRADHGDVRRPGRYESRFARAADHGCATGASIRPAASRWRDGWRSGQKFCGCCTRRLKAILAIRSGGGTFRRACGLFSVVFKPATQTAVNAFLNALTLVWHRRIVGWLRKPRHTRLIATAFEPRRPGRLVDQPCGFTSALKIPTILSPISSAALPLSAQASSQAHRVCVREVRSEGFANR